MTDIVQKLRDRFSRGGDWDYVCDAADEIERLQRELDERTAAANVRMFDQNAEIKRLRAMLFRARDYIAGERTADRPRDAMLERIDPALEQSKSG